MLVASWYNRELKKKQAKGVESIVSYNQTIYEILKLKVLQELDFLYQTLVEPFSNGLFAITITY